LQAHLSALLTYRVAAGVPQHLLPIDACRSPETLRNHTLRIGAQLGTATSDQPTPAAVAATTVSVDSTFIRGREEGERHQAAIRTTGMTNRIGKSIALLPSERE